MKSVARSSALPVLFLLAVVMLAFIVFPVAGLVSRVPYGTAWGQLRSGALLDALRISLVVSLLSALLSLLFGFPLAWVLARTTFPGRSVARVFVALPMVLPPVVGGVALLTAFGRKGVLGGALGALGIQLPFTIAGAVAAATFVSAPFLILTVEAALSSTDRRLEEAAASLGASQWTILRSVTLPAIRPSLVAGMALSWARAIGEFGATITFAGNLRGRTQTMPLAVYETLQINHEGAILMSLLLLLLSLTVLLLLRKRLVPS